MGRLIDADKLSADMYHEAFEKDSDMQKWDSGCWIRYKMFENVLKAQPTVEPDTTTHDSIPAETGKNDGDRTSGDCISRQQAIDEIHEDAEWLASQGSDWQVERMERDKSILMSLPSVQPETNCSEIPNNSDTISRKERKMTDTEMRRREAICKVAGVSEIDDVSDGFHTFRQLYYQRMMLFAAIVRQNKDKAWKSFRHEDGELCFGGGWFIVGIDTPEGSYTYHYEDSYFGLFDCEELKRGKHWDGHTEKDVTRLLSLPSAQPDTTTHDSIPAETGKNDGDRTSGDCISRTQAIDEIHEDAEWLASQGSDWQVERMERDKSILMSLPSVQPEINRSEFPNNSDTISRQALPYYIEPDGTLTITVPKGMKRIGRILIEEDGTQYGGLFYPDEE